MMAQGAWQLTPLPSHSEGTWEGGSPTGAETLTPLPLLTQQAQQPQSTHTWMQQMVPRAIVILQPG